MNRIQFILKNVNLLNLLLTALLIYSANPLLASLNVKVDIKPFTEVNKGSVFMKDDQSLSDEHPTLETPSLSEYALIGEKNLFHPERRIVEKEEQKKQIVRPNVIFYGSLITDTTRLAFIKDANAPHATPGRGERQRVLKVGDSLSGYTLKEIQHDRVVLAYGEDIMTVNVMEQSKRKKIAESKTDKTEKLPPRAPQKPVVKFFPGRGVDFY